MSTPRVEIARPVGAFEPGTVLGGGWRLVERVAEGRFSVVWRADDLRHGTPVAIKVATSDLGARMLRAERQATREIGWLGPSEPRRSAPSIVGVRWFEDGERPWLVMSWCGDGTLRTALARHDRAWAMERFFEVLDTVAIVHGLGIAHGDLKPENILMVGDTPFLTDFGFAREIARERLSQSLRHSMSASEGIAGGTLAYMPPEAVKGAEPSLAGDVYALGVMLHELLLGRRPDKATGPEVLRKLLPEEVVDVLTRALAFDPKDRIADARQLRQDLAPSRETLTARGALRAGKSALALAKATLAAFFVALRYASVAALLTAYAVLAFVGLTVHPAIWLGFAPIVLLHAVIRWEGPETEQEARLRRSGLVAGRES